MTTTEERVLDREPAEHELPEDADERGDDFTDAAEGAPDCTCEGGIVRL